MYKFCILAAGKGTRNGAIDDLHKALLPLENKAVISHIIERVPINIELVIAVGFKSEQIKTYINNVHKDRKITYVNVEKYEGIGSGPGHSLLQCEKELQCPFIYTAADTVIEVDYKFKRFAHNWIGVSNIDEADSSFYCLVEGEKYLEKFYYGKGTKAYVGIAAIYEYAKYWESLKDDILIFNERQVLNGFKNLNKVEFKYFNWYDTGNTNAYHKTRSHFSKEIVAPKNNECIFIEKNVVTKFFTDVDKLNKRIERTNHLNNTVPLVTKINENMYSYNLVNGKILSEIYDENVLSELLPFWNKKLGSCRYERTDAFIKNCKSMYHEKTFERCERYFNSDLDNIKIINGIKVDKIKTLLNKVDWNLMYDNAIPSKFHGDFQPENIIYAKNNTFCLIDWRESFGKDLEIGDAYYDLSKLYHALRINGTDVNNKLYHVEIKNSHAFISHHTRVNLIFLMQELENFCKNNNYSWKTVELMGILQYLNIASLYDSFHDGNYGRFLFLYGKYLLTKMLK